jgi:four helix bundle protein
MTNEVNNMEERDPLGKKSFEFAVRILKLYKYLTEEKREFVLSKQILRSGTNPGAMVREAKYAESADDFIHKLAVARKEAYETQYWLDLLHAGQYLSETEYQSIFADSEVIIKLLTSSIKTKRKNN